ncbi:hypothetical protein JCM8097_004717 [Rhodosporidiobolus ruineniae]
MQHASRRVLARSFSSSPAPRLPRLRRRLCAPTRTGAKQIALLTELVQQVTALQKELERQKDGEKRQAAETLQAVKDMEQREQEKDARDTKDALVWLGGFGLGLVTLPFYIRWRRGHWPFYGPSKEEAAEFYAAHGHRGGQPPALFFLRAKAMSSGGM